MILAALGGTPVVDVPEPDMKWPRYATATAKAVMQMVLDGEVAYTDRERPIGAFEAEFAKLTNTRHALAVNSGTNALHSAFFGLGLESGSQVLVPAYSFIATATPLLAANLVPVFVDVDPETGNLDPSAVAAAFSARTGAVAATHLNGFPADMESLVAICDQRGVLTIEDASQAHGAIASGKPVGSWGNVAAFSCQAKKLVPAGTGGVMVTSDERIYQRAVLLGHFLQRAQTDVTEADLAVYADTGWGLNNRIHPLGAALGLDGLRNLPKWLRIRRANCERLDSGLAGMRGIRAPVVQPHMTQVVDYSYQPLFLPEELPRVSRDTLVRALQAEGVPVTVPKSPPLPSMSGFSQDQIQMTPLRGLKSKDRPGRHGPFRGAEYYFRHALRLPVFPLSAEQYVDRLIEAFEKVLGTPDELLRLESG